ncbi:hypothetical protein AHAS_Ahas20G0201200 [Arachis hypogaea]
MFIATRTSRKRKEVDEETQTAVEDFQHCQAAGETEEEVFEALFGKEQPGRHKEEMSSLKDELGHMEAQQQKKRGQTAKIRGRDSWVVKYDQVNTAAIGTWNEARRTRSFITRCLTVSD